LFEWRGHFAWRKNTNMQMPLEIRFIGMDPSPALETAIREHVAKLEEFDRDIISCRVAVDAPHKHHRQGKLFKITVDVRLPGGGEVVASRSPAQHHAHEDAHVALRDAFKAVRRQIQEHVRVQRGRVKSHDVPPHGKVASLMPDQDHGFIATPDGREVYFHRNSLVDAEFEGLEVGTEVRFNEEPGDQGARATSVYVIGKHHIVG
jgi:cold shock CspA family protein/ribosome-associated translation inhibitor RaiA